MHILARPPRLASDHILRELPIPDQCCQCAAEAVWQAGIGLLRQSVSSQGSVALLPCRPRLIDMAEHPEGFPVDQEQALLVICSTQVPPTPPLHASRPGLTVCVWMNA